MAHFPPSFLDEVLARTDLVDLIARHVELKKSGANLMGLCPFHHEKSPSFSVSPDKQLYYCFGCGKGGGAFQFLMDHDGYSFPEAVEYLAEKAGLEIPREVRREAGEATRNPLALQMLEKAAAAFSRMLATDAGIKARAYLKHRGLPQNIIRDYSLGYAPSGYGFMERVFGRDPGRMQLLESVGLVFKGERGYGDRFRDRLMFPIRDRRGHVVGFGGRVLDGGEPKYLNSPETPWFHKSALLYGLAEHRDAIRREKLLIVVEGYMDVLALAAHALPVGLAPLGTAIGESQLREIFRLCETPVFCFDGDRAGRQAAWRALERMMPLLVAELSPRFLFLPEGEDPDSLLLSEGGEAFRKRLEAQSRPVLETWLAGLKLLAGKAPEGRARMAKKADAMLARMQDAYLQQLWRQEAEKTSGIPLQAGGRQIRHRIAPQQRPAAEITAVEERFLAGLLQCPQRWRSLPKVASNFFVDKPDIKKVYMRAFSIVTGAQGQNAHIARQLMREFPDDSRIPRWINQTTVQDIEFESLLLDMEANYIRALQQRGGLTLDESMRLKRRLQTIEARQQELRKTMDTTAGA